MSEKRRQRYKDFIMRTRDKIFAKSEAKRQVKKKTKEEKREERRVKQKEKRKEKKEVARAAKEASLEGVSTTTTLAGPSKPEETTLTIEVEKEGNRPSQ